MSGPFDRFIGVDWSGAAKPSEQQVYVAEAHRQGARITLHSVVRAHDRYAVEDFLRGAPLRHAPAWEEWPGPGRLIGRARRVVALDFAFGFPAAFRHPDLAGEWSWEDLASFAAGLDNGRPGNGSESETVRRLLAEDPELARQFRFGRGASAEMHLRITDERAPSRPESVFQLVGPSQVGIGSITGIAMLHRLRGTEGVAIWPFDPPERIAEARAVLVEIWPRMWLGPGLRKYELPDRARQVEMWQREGIAMRTKAELAAAASPDALDAAAAAIGAARCCYRLPSPEALPEDARLREGWIAGVQVP